MWKPLALLFAWAVLPSLCTLLVGYNPRHSELRVGLDATRDLGLLDQLALGARTLAAPPLLQGDAQPLATGQVTRSIGVVPPAGSRSVSVVPPQLHATLVASVPQFRSLQQASVTNVPFLA